MSNKENVLKCASGDGSKCHFLNNPEFKFDTEFTRLVIKDPYSSDVAMVMTRAHAISIVRYLNRKLNE